VSRASKDSAAIRLATRWAVAGWLKLARALEQLRRPPPGLVQRPLGEPCLCPLSSDHCGDGVRWPLVEPRAGRRGGVLEADAGAEPAAVLATSLPAKRSPCMALWYRSGGGGVSSSTAAYSDGTGK
jgi:hypothetical protein